MKSSVANISMESLIATCRRSRDGDADALKELQTFGRQLMGFGRLEGIATLKRELRQAEISTFGNFAPADGFSASEELHKAWSPIKTVAEILATKSAVCALSIGAIRNMCEASFQDRRYAPGSMAASFSLTALGKRILAERGLAAMKALHQEQWAAEIELRSSSLSKRDFNASEEIALIWTISIPQWTQN